MSTIKTNNVQVGHGEANYTISVPYPQDSTLNITQHDDGSSTDIITIEANNSVTVGNIQAATISAPQTLMNKIIDSCQVSIGGSKGINGQVLFSQGGSFIWDNIAAGTKIGNTILSSRIEPPQGFLPADGSVYLQSAYPELFAAIGLLGPDYQNLITKLANPATLPTDFGFGVAFSPDGTYMAVAHDGTPYITIYKRSGDTFTKLDNPATLPTGTGTGVAFSSDGTYMAVAHQTSPFIAIYKRSGDTFTKLANPATLPTGTGYGVAFSPDGTYMAVAHDTSPFIAIYKRSGDVFTKLANPATLPAGNGRGVAFSSDGTYMAVAHGTSPYITIYKRSGDTFTKLANPTTLPASTGIGVAFSSDGTYMAVAHDTSPFVTIYKRSGDVFTKLADPAVLPTGTGRGVAFSSDGTYMAVAHGTSPFITIYKGTPINDPLTEFYVPKINADIITNDALPYIKAEE